MNRYQKFRIFAEVDFDSYSGGQLQTLKQQIEGGNREYLLNINEEKYIDHLVSRFTIEPLVLHFDNVEASSKEKMIPAERFPFNFNVYRGKSYPKPVIKYHLPVTGDLNLLRCMPNPRLLNSHPVSFEE